jgi:hypothetical protein
MTPIITQSREDLPIPVTGTMRVAGRVAPYSDDYWYRASRFETTTSFRSHRSGADDLTDEDGFTGSQGTRAEFQRELAKSDRELGKPPMDTGHEFKSVKRTIELPTKNWSVSRTSGHPFWGRDPISLTGATALPFASGRLSPQWPALVEPSLAEINLDGARAINETLPTKPSAGLMQFLGELREQLPQLLGHAFAQYALGPKAVGNEYLNVTFGWRPFLNDLLKMALSVKKGNALLRQFMRDDNRQIRRRRTLFEGQALTEVSESWGNVTYPLSGQSLPYGNEGLIAYPGLTRVTDFVSQKVWFSGAYTYLLADLSSWVREAERYDQLADRLLGTRLSPAVLWELTPWSWMLDWFGNFSAVAQNADALTSDSLSLRYGYVMHHYQVRREVITFGMIDFQGERLDSVRCYLTVDSKTRTRATPYGFGLDLSDLSPKQWAIVGALGGTKTPRGLRLDEPPQPRLKPQKGYKRPPRTPRKPRIRA